MEKKSPDAEETYRTIFRDYCNKRDQIQQSLGVPKLELTPEQSQRVLNMARTHYRHREVLHGNQWFKEFVYDTNAYFCYPEAFRRRTTSFR